MFFFNFQVFFSQASVGPRSALNSSTFQRFRFISSATPQSNEESTESKNEQEHKGNNETGAASSQSNEKETSRSGNEQEGKENNEATADTSHQTEASVSDCTSESGIATVDAWDCERNKETELLAFLDLFADSESGLSRDELVKLVADKEQLLVTKTEELQQMKDKVLRAYAEMENVKDRTRRESENAKKFAIQVRRFVSICWKGSHRLPLLFLFSTRRSSHLINLDVMQNFAKSLLDVADNLNRASSAAKESFSKIDTSSDTSGAIKQLKTLPEGVEMTEKQLMEVLLLFF